MRLLKSGSNILKMGCKNWFEKISKDLTLPSFFKRFGATLFRAGGESNRYPEKVNHFYFTFFKNLKKW